jgi:diaminopropionate ammonia-lyase
MATFYLSAPQQPAQNLFASRDFAESHAFFAGRPALAATPLHRLDGLARRLGLAAVLAKDETRRFGLNAFKAVGTQFAVNTLIARGTIEAGDTLACASEGNHGRAVARAASEAGCRAVVYMSDTVVPARVAAIESEGATVVRVRGTYDEAVREMAAAAKSQGWTVVSDTSWPGYSEIPRLIMLGYTRLLEEDWGGSDTSSHVARPDVIFAPAGVGGLLGAVASWVAWKYGGDPPRIVSVEPRSAACVQASVQAGAPIRVDGPFETVMGGLRCGEMSPDTFPVISTVVDALIGIEDDWAFEAMRLLARPEGDDPVILAGASGAAALGGLLAVLKDPDLGAVRARLALGGRSRVEVLVSEGATDPEHLDRVLARP